MDSRAEKISRTKREKAREGVLLQIKALESERGVTIDASGYETNITPLPVIGICGHPFKADLNHFQKDRWTGLCPQCHFDRLRGISLERGRQSFLSLTKSLGLTVLSEYVSATARVSLIGTCGHPFEASPNKLQRKKNGLCSRCAKHPTGDEHPRWNPDLTDADRLSGWYGRSRQGSERNIARTREPTLQKIRDLTSARGVLCDIDAYVTNKTKLRMVGSCGHPFLMSWNEFSHHKKDGLCQWCAHPRGEAHHKWKPELTAEHRAKFEDPNLKTWSRRVLASADWTCDITSERGVELEAHHLSNKADNEDVKFELSNGVAIAKEFHTLFHSKFYFGKVDNTPEQYAAFKEMIWAS